MEPRASLGSQAYGMRAPLVVGDSVIRTERFGFSYPDAMLPEVCDLTFAVQRHEILWFVGRSGAGKTRRKTS